jgi:hypothetical protein
MFDGQFSQRKEEIGLIVRNRPEANIGKNELLMQHCLLIRPNVKLGAVENRGRCALNGRVIF